MGLITAVVLTCPIHLSTASGNHTFSAALNPYKTSSFNTNTLLCMKTQSFLSLVHYIRYLDQLGMASKYHTKVYCRQTLIGGNYGLLNATTFVPNPDYYRQELEI